MTGLALVLLAAALRGVVGVRSGRARPVTAAAVWLVVAGGLAVVLLGQLLFVSEGSLPRDDLAGRLPAGVRVVAHEQLCGSGGCWREYTVVADRTASGAILAERLRAAGLAGCRHRTWVPDLRRRCTDVAALGGAALGDAVGEATLGDAAPGDAARVTTYLTGL